MVSDHWPRINHYSVSVPTVAVAKVMLGHRDALAQTDRKNSVVPYSKPVDKPPISKTSQNLPKPSKNPRVPAVGAISWLPPPGHSSPLGFPTGLPDVHPQPFPWLRDGLLQQLRHALGAVPALPAPQTRRQGRVEAPHQGLQVTEEAADLTADAGGRHG